MNITGANYIAGSTSQFGTATFTSVNPRTKANGEVQFHDATVNEINKAVEAAAEAFKVTRNLSAAQLADFLDTCAAEIEAIGDDLIQTADMETALGAAPRLSGERGRTTGQLRAFANLLREGSYVEAIIDTALPDRQPAPRPDIRRMLFPIGPVAVFPPNNFPLAFSVAGEDTASAFAAGCPVILKAHPSHPATSELVAQAIVKAVKAHNLPAGFFSMVQGSSIEVGQALVNHPKLAAVALTGSLRGGRAIYDSAAKRPHPIPVYAEMGSINPMVILPGIVAAQSDTLATGLVNSVTLGTGQFCTNPGLIFMIDNGESTAFINKVAQQMTQKQPGVLLNAGVQSGLTKAVAQTLKQSGVENLAGGKAVDEGGFCFENTVLKTTSEEFKANPALQQEHFGPVTLFVMCSSLADLTETLDKVEGNLTATVHAVESELADAAGVFDLLREKAGRLILNGFPTGVEVVYSQQHGGPYPATSAPGTTSVGMTAIKRFLRPVAFQNSPDALLPDALKNANPLKILRIVNNAYTRDAVQ